MDASVSSDQEILSGLEEHVEVEVSVFQIEREEPEDAIIRIRLGNRLRQRRRRQRLRAARSEAERMEPLQNECAVQVTGHENEQTETDSENLQLNQEGQLESLAIGNNAESSTVEDTADQLEENRETIDLQDFERILRRRESIRLSQRRRRERLRNLSRSLESSDPLARCRSMILGFRISELQALLRFAGRSKSGSKHELVSRALQLVRTNCSSEILKKIQDLHAQRNGATTNTQSQQLLPTPTFPLHSSEAALNARTSVPICHTGKDDTKSKVRLTKLPFYTILDDLMKPTELVPTNSERIQENQFTFTLTEKQRNQIIAGCSNNGVHSVQVQLRICHTNTEFIQEDQYPPYFSIKVNSRVCPFTSYFSSNKPGVEPKRPCRPIDVTPLLNLTTTRGANYLGIFWGHFAKRYSVVLYLVKQHRVAELLHKLKVNETRASEISRELIRKKLQLEPDNDVTTTGLRVSLMCSLGKMRLSVPCRGITCTHLQCFDAALYIQMNEKKPTWMCPVCDKPAPYELLFVDQLYLLRDQLQVGRQLDKASLTQQHQPVFRYIEGV
ncbi:E3 SUMO-protein ligase PIAS4-like isoform X2 [Narcine bancroftii]|uniref:E3 SUMO-protein ligase PIAS4-like isoform X2 n=1 Tax=Narcine bancroftii TaxID=1343680 RepID=UPI0038313589